MVCIVCLATIAAIGFGAGVIAEEVLSKRLENLAKSGGITRETESVASWSGEFEAKLDDGGTKLVPVAIQYFKDSGRVRIQLDDHSLSQAEAEHLEDEILEALGAEPVERRYPSDGAGGLESEHEHPDEVAEPVAEEAEEAEEGRQAPAARPQR